MKVIVDYDRCEANAICMQICPQVFKLNEDDTRDVLIEEPGDDLRAKVLEAVHRCPRQAITVKG